MKDYTLSEIKAHCEKMHDRYGGEACIRCEKGISGFCMGQFLSKPCFGWNDIEPRDMIELPYKEFHEVYAGQGLWFVFYRAEGRLMDSRYFNEEESADAFLAELKGGRNGN